MGSPTPLSSGDGDAVDIGEGAIWFVDTSEDTTRVARIDPESRKVTARPRVPDGINGDLAVGEGGVWVVNQERSSITYIDARSAKVVGEPIVVGKPADGFGGEVAVGGGAVWATSPEDDTVSRIDPRSRKVVKRIKVPSGVGSDIAFGLGRLWVVDDSSSLVPIDPASNAVAGRPLPGSPVGADDVEVGSDAIWVLGGVDEDTVLRIEP